MDLDRMHRAVRALVKGDEIPSDLSVMERKAVSTLRQQMDASPVAAGIRWIAAGANWFASSVRAFP